MHSELVNVLFSVIACTQKEKSYNQQAVQQPDDLITETVNSTFDSWQYPCLCLSTDTRIGLLLIKGA